MLMLPFEVKELAKVEWWSTRVKFLNVPNMHRSMGCGGLVLESAQLGICLPAVLGSLLPMGACDVVGGSREHGPHASEAAGGGRTRRDWRERLWHMRDLVYAYGWSYVWVVLASIRNVRLSRLMRLLNWCISLSKKCNCGYTGLVEYL